MRLQGMVLVLAFGLVSCFGKKEAPPAESMPPMPVAAPTKAVKPARDPELVRIVKLATQADQVQREAWRVIANEKRAAPRSAFGKLQRAALTALDGRLAVKGVFNCDRYTFSRGVATGSMTASWTFYEKCSEKAGEKEIVSWTPTGPRRAKVEFVPANLGEVLGVGASIFGQSLVCELGWSDNDILEHLSCPKWEQDRGSQIVRLEIFEFRRDQGLLLRLRGQVLENLQPVRKINADVPMTGKIVVTETELNPPEPEPPKPPEVPIAPPAKNAIAPAPVPGAAPGEEAPEGVVDPDLRRHRQPSPPHVRGLIGPAVPPPSAENEATMDGETGEGHPMEGENSGEESGMDPNEGDPGAESADGDDPSVEEMMSVEESESGEDPNGEAPVLDPQSPAEGEDAAPVAPMAEPEYHPISPGR